MGITLLRVFPANREWGQEPMGLCHSRSEVLFQAKIRRFLVICSSTASFSFRLYTLCSESNVIYVPVANLVDRELNPLFVGDLANIIPSTAWMDVCVEPVPYYHTVPSDPSGTGLISTGASSVGFLSHCAMASPGFASGVVPDVVP